MQGMSCYSKGEADTCAMKARTVDGYAIDYIAVLSCFPRSSIFPIPRDRPACGCSSQSKCPENHLVIDSTLD